MANIFSRLSEGGGIFRDEAPLRPDYMPDDILHREREIREIAMSLRLADGRKPENLIINGATGTGKTTCARHVLKELSEYSQRAVPVYINCWEYSTRHAILNQIATALGEMMPRRGISTDEITERVMEILGKERKVPVVVLDEIDRLMVSQYGEEKIIYDLARASEVFSVDFGVVGITNSEEFMSKLDPRIRSSLAQKHLVFKQYTPQQLKDIVAERAKLALFRQAIGNEVVETCAAVGAKRGGDARVAINCLWMAGKEAEKVSARQVTVEHVKAVADEAAEESAGQGVILSDMEARILKLVEEKGEMRSGDLYKLIGGKETDRTIRNY